MTNATEGVIQNIIFDLGDVLINVDWTAFSEFLKSHGAQLASRAEFCQKTSAEAYHCGQISSRDFVSNIQKLLSVPAEREEIVSGWNNMFSLKPRMLELAKTLKEHYRTFILSNTNELHWDFVRQNLGIDLWTHGQMPSHIVHAAKPDPAIFKEAEKEFNLVPAQSVLIDDLERNIVGAQNMGWQAIQHRSEEETISELRALGVHC